MQKELIKWIFKKYNITAIPMIIFDEKIIPSYISLKKT